MKELKNITASVYAYFGETSDDAIDSIFQETFDKPSNRDNDKWTITISTGHELSVCRIQNGWDKFVELFRESVVELKRIDELLAFELTEGHNLKRDRPFEHWLHFGIAGPADSSFSDACGDLWTLKNNFLESFEGIAFEFDECEATVRHPCGGITGGYLYQFAIGLSSATELEFNLVHWKKVEIRQEIRNTVGKLVGCIIIESDGDATAFDARNLKLGFYDA